LILELVICNLLYHFDFETTEMVVIILIIFATVLFWLMINWDAWQYYFFCFVMLLCNLEHNSLWKVKTKCTLPRWYWFWMILSLLSDHIWTNPGSNTVVVRCGNLFWKLSLHKAWWIFWDIKIRVYRIQWNELLSFLVLSFDKYGLNAKTNQTTSLSVD